jgi:hypothetical protein
MSDKPKVKLEEIEPLTEDDEAILDKVWANLAAEGHPSDPVQPPSGWLKAKYEAYCAQYEAEEAAARAPALPEPNEKEETK